MIPENYLEKVYAGFLGMNVGIRLGAPLEPTEWTYEVIQQYHGDIRGYVKEYKTFAADDDANGPVFFIRALIDDAHDRELQAEDVGRAWLNYSREGIGMFWWGGEGISTEHTAYLNLKKGIPAPHSGSAEQNGIILAEQIGGQIFVDTWGLLLPNEIEKAAMYSERAASVSHDKNGLYGARFIAACISKAFSAKSIEEIIITGLSTIPEDSTYAKVVNAVIDFHKKNPEDFRACRQYLEDEWGYDKYTGVCHIIPNAGIIVLSLLYGKGNFSRTIEIATMCGWDTDCNAGNVGTITGVLNGIEGIPDHYRKPINDAIVTSSVSGYLNVLDIPTFSKELAIMGYILAGEKAPDTLVDSVRNGEVYFDFELSGSTHGFKTSNNFKTLLRHSDEVGFERKGSLEVLFDRMVDGDQSKIFYKPFYRREEFSDEKYKPTFSPTAYSGQVVSVKIYLDKWQGEDLFVTPYVRNTFNKKDLKLQPIVLKNQQWNDVEFVIPDSEGAMIDEVGYIIESPSTLTNRAFGKLYIDQFHIHGNAKYTIDFKKQAIEFKSITPFAHHRGEWLLENGYMSCTTLEDATSYTGNYYAKDLEVEGEIYPVDGKSHGIIFRSLGTERYYFVGFDGDGKVSLIKNDFGFEHVMTVPFIWKNKKSYHFKVILEGDKVQFIINDEKVIEFEGISFDNGMVGFGLLDKGTSEMHSFKLVETN